MRTVGIAQPIIIRFNEAVGDRATAERAIRVTTDPPVEGSFYWINDSQVRWKPTQFLAGEHLRDRRRR